MTQAERDELVRQIVDELWALLSEAEGSEEEPAREPEELAAGADVEEDAGDVEAEGYEGPALAPLPDGYPAEFPLPWGNGKVYWRGTLLAPYLPVTLVVGADEAGRPAMAVVETGVVMGRDDEGVWVYDPEEEMADEAVGGTSSEGSEAA